MQDESATGSNPISASEGTAPQVFAPSNENVNLTPLGEAPDIPLTTETALPPAFKNDQISSPGSSISTEAADNKVNETTFNATATQPETTVNSQEGEDTHKTDANVLLGILAKYYKPEELANTNPREVVELLQKIGVKLSSMSKEQLNSYIEGVIDAAKMYSGRIKESPKPI